MINLIGHIWIDESNVVKIDDGESHRSLGGPIYMLPSLLWREVALYGGCAIKDETLIRICVDEMKGRPQYTELGFCKETPLSVSFSDKVKKTVDIFHTRENFTINFWSKLRNIKEWDTTHVCYLDSVEFDDETWNNILKSEFLSTDIQQIDNICESSFRRFDEFDLVFMKNDQYEKTFLANPRPYEMTVVIKDLGKIRVVGRGVDHTFNYTPVDFDHLIGIGDIFAGQCLNHLECARKYFNDVNTPATLAKNLDRIHENTINTIIDRNLRW